MKRFVPTTVLPATVPISSQPMTNCVAMARPTTDSAPVAMALTAGSFSLHHELAVHRSAPNRAAHRRVGIGLNYIPTHVRVNSPVRLKAMLPRAASWP